LFGILKHHW